jgi:hypothetical protein
MRAIEERKVQRLGDGKETAVDVSVIFATNKDLKTLVAAGRFLDDFLNRINGFEIIVPPLRERREDIPLLAETLATQIRAKGVWAGKITDAALAVLQAREWREGNVRELRSVLQRAATNNPWQDLTEADVSDVGGNGARVSDLPSPDVVGGSKEHGSGGGNVLPEPVTAAAGLRPPFSALPDVGALTLAEIKAIKQDGAGFLGAYVADALTFALRLTQKAGGELNPTAAVRFLLGDEGLTTTQAKQFLKRTLGLDTKGLNINAAFAKTGLAAEHPLLAWALAETARPRRADKRLKGGATDGQD